MQTLKTFFRTIFKSSTDPRYYQDVVATPSSFSWKYFFAFNLLAAMVTGVTIMIPLALLDVTGMVNSAVEIYPSDLEVKVDDQGLAINQPLPYAIPFPEIDHNKTDMNLVVFADEVQITGMQDIRDLNSLVVMTQQEVYVQENIDTGETRVYSIPKYQESWQINRATVDSLAQTITNNPFVQQRLYLPLIALVLFLLVYPLTIVMRLFVITIFSFITWVLVMLFMKQKELSYGQIFQMSIHSLTPVILIAYALGMVGWVLFHGWPYLVAYLVWTLFVISKLNDVRVTGSESQPKTVTRKTPVKTKARKTPSKK